MLPVWTVMQKAVQKLNAIAVVSRNIFKFFRIFSVILFQRVQPYFLHPIGGALIKNFNFIERSFQIL